MQSLTFQRSVDFGNLHKWGKIKSLRARFKRITQSLCYVYVIN
jgi:hypothetical protein